jgi:hypothetical protein
MLVSSRVAERLVASQEGLSSTELVGWLVSIICFRVVRVM